MLPYLTDLQQLVVNIENIGQQGVFKFIVHLFKRIYGVMYKVVDSLVTDN